MEHSEFEFPGLAVKSFMQLWKKFKSLTKTIEPSLLGFIPFSITMGDKE